MKKDEKKEIYLVQESAFWSTIQDVVHDGVVQVVAQVGQFDWCDPYKVDELYENYGSGFIINKHGYVVTNMHVVHNAKYLWIYMPCLGRKKLDAHVVSICPDRDLALLKISNDGLETIHKKISKVPVLMMGDSDGVRRADNVLVLGYPLGKHNLKSTTGIVSGHEFIFGTTLLQITAPINPGNSGGPIFNLMGHVIGITIAVESAAQNIGYVIPINELAIIIDDLIKGNIVRKPRLGARFVDASDEKATLLHNPHPAGWYIATVFKGTLLDKAGALSGDMLYSFNGYEIDAYGETNVPWAVERVSVYDLMSRVRHGDKIKFVLYRNGEKKDITCTAEALDPFAIRARFPGYEKIDYEIIGGMVIMELAQNHIEQLIDESPELVRYYHPEYCLDPVLVITTILPGSYVHALRTLKPGDIIKSVNDVLVATLEDFRKAIRKNTVHGLLSIVVETEILVVLSLHKILQDEKRLSEAFVYPVSSLVKKLQQLIKQKKSTPAQRKQVKGATRGKNKKTT